MIWLNSFKHTQKISYSVLQAWTCDPFFTTNLCWLQASASQDCQHHKNTCGHSKNACENHNRVKIHKLSQAWVCSAFFTSMYLCISQPSSTGACVEHNKQSHTRLATITYLWATQAPAQLSLWRAQVYACKNSTEFFLSEDNKVQYLALVSSIKICLP